MEDKLEEYEKSCSLLGKEESSNLVNHEISNIEEEIERLVSEISNQPDNDDKDIIKTLYDENLMYETVYTETDHSYQKADLGRLFSGECSQGSKPKTLVRSHSSPEPVFRNLSVNEQDEQNIAEGFAENLTRICECDSVHSSNDREFLENEGEKETPYIASSISDNGLSPTEQNDTQRTPTNTSNDSYKLIVEDKYLNVYNMCRRDSPSPVFENRGEKLVYQTLVPTAEIYELCRSSRNRPKKFYFPLENSPDQDSTQAKLPISKLAIEQCNKTEETAD
ncbi:hypothetical protein HNY73_007293 [Argiope bruennichi]|uniref:Uncharacterized protein n=1 Tax=Argiope bruennichi TaxID=94029 RepID=A0A8T0FG45_ARGBR|nr:hypothetical protein HNY73_007293 [Argiope bruennichi]